MSLIRQLWLAVVLSVVVAVAGSLSISIWSARSYLIGQLERKNGDNAASLALAITRDAKDPVSIELNVAAMFDTGSYREISVTDQRGEAIVARLQDRKDAAVPSWFMSLFSIPSPPGTARINDGWKQYGTVRVVSDSHFAYKALWDEVWRLAAWFATVGMAVALLGMALLRRIGRALGDVVGQAKALSERRFITVAEPAIPELRAVTRAMNEVVVRLRGILAEESAQLESCRRKVDCDAVTGLSTREHFLAHLRDLVGTDAFAPAGSLVLVRISAIDKLNARLGYQRTDGMLKQLGTVLLEICGERPGQLAGRMKGGEFAVVCPACDDPAAAARQIHERLARDWLPAWSAEVPDLFHLAAVQYQRHQSLASVLTEADEALARAACLRPNACFAAAARGRVSLPAAQWRALLAEAVENRRFSLAFFPVVACGDGARLHQEAMLRLQAKDADSLLSAGDFMPMAARLDATAPLDLTAATMAIEHLRHNAGDVAVNLSAETVDDFNFHIRLAELLGKHPDLCRRLLFEVQEYGVVRAFDAFHDLSGTLKQLGCRVGIEYFGLVCSEMDKLTVLGLDYIKVDPSCTRDLESNADNRERLTRLCRFAHGLGIEVIALGVDSKAVLPLLAALGFDGATGPAID